MSVLVLDLSDQISGSRPIKPGERQFWRVLNASADTYVNLAVEYDGKRLLLGLVSLDGVPLRFGEPDSENYVPEQTDTFLSPAGRGIRHHRSAGGSCRATGYVFHISRSG